MDSVRPLKIRAWSFLTRIGRCPRCMRQSGYATLASLLLFCLLRERYSLAVLAVFSLVSLLHLCVYTYRSTREDIHPERRQFLSAALGGLILIFSVSSFAGRAFAENPCSGRMNCGHSRCQAEDTCCPLGYTFLSLCDCRCYKQGSNMPTCSEPLALGSVTVIGCYDQNW
ncbi:hypothetical protein [Mesorhizobium comanense]|uniref:hypothetical protein n=1 Tax=Mesorhizobium comanense TaxID=2502215 RepID=UPI001484D719|nr:hypothetical protein [Mesorhizobium comanense]